MKSDAESALIAVRDSLARFHGGKVVPERHDHDQNFFSFCYLLIRGKSIQALEPAIHNYSSKRLKSGSKMALATKPYS